MKNLTFFFLITLHYSLFTAHSFSQSFPPPDFAFNSQAQVDSFPINYPNVTVLDGDVSIGFIGATDITNLDSLIGLTSITGNFSIGHYGIDPIPGGLSCWGNPLLNDVSGLSNLTNIGEGFYIFCNDALSNLSGLESLTNIGGSLVIGYAQVDMTGPQFAGNYSLSDISALESLTSIEGDIEINGNGSLTSLAGLGNIDANSIENIRISFNESLSICDVQSICDYLSDPAGTVDIYNNAPGCNNPGEIAETCGFQLPCLPFGNYYFTSQAEVDNFQTNYPDCFDLYGDIIIWENDNSAITNLSGLSGINSVGGNLEIMGNEVLENLTGMKNLQTLGGELTIGDVWYDVNPSLTSLTGLGGLNSIGGDLQIHGNDALSVCDIKVICDYLAVPNGNIYIGSNAPGCDSPEEVEEACESHCLPEGIIFTSQAQIDSFQVNYPSCSEIDGDVKIGTEEITDITNVDGLNVLTSIGGNLTVIGYETLANIDGLNNLYSIGGNLKIAQTERIKDLEGLSSLNFISGSLSLLGNDSLQSLQGLENLTSIDSTISINLNSALINFTGLDNVTSIGKNLMIDLNWSLEDLTGLGGLISIDGDLFIGGIEPALWHGNPLLMDLSGLENLNYIGGGLTIGGNNSLASLTGLNNLNSIGQNLSIFDNDTLSYCQILAICNYLEDPNGYVYIANNAKDCNSQEEVLEACGQNVDERTDIINSSIYPNPLSSTITIEFELWQPEIVTITLYNHYGEKVKHAISGKSTGKQKIEWNCQGLPAGIYFCVIKTNLPVGEQTTKIIKL